MNERAMWPVAAVLVAAVLTLLNVASYFVAIQGLYARVVTAINAAAPALAPFDPQKSAAALYQSGARELVQTHIVFEVVIIGALVLALVWIRSSRS